MQSAPPPPSLRRYRAPQNPLHKSLKNPHHHHAGGGNRQAPQQQKTPSAPPSKAPSVQTAPSVTDEPPAPADKPRRQDQPAAEAPAPAGGQQEPQHKICDGFGRPETSDLTVMLYGKEGIDTASSEQGLWS